MPPSPSPSPSPSPNKKNGVPPPNAADVAASRTRYAALKEEIEELSRRRDDWTAEDRRVFAAKRVALKKLRAAQANGDFTMQ